MSTGCVLGLIYIDKRIQSTADIKIPFGMEGIFHG